MHRSRSLPNAQNQSECSDVILGRTTNRSESEQVWPQRGGGAELSHDPFTQTDETRHTEHSDRCRNCPPKFAGNVGQSRRCAPPWTPPGPAPAHGRPPRGAWWSTAAGRGVAALGPGRAQAAVAYAPRRGGGAPGALRARGGTACAADTGGRGSASGATSLHSAPDPHQGCLVTDIWISKAKLALATLNRGKEVNKKNILPWNKNWFGESLQPVGEAMLPI